MRRALETLSLFTLVIVVALRPLIAESCDSAGTSFTRELGDVADPSPVRTLVFDFAILVAAWGWLLARARGPSTARYRWTGLEWGTAILIVASLISCAAAGNKRLAVNGAVDWLCYPILTMALVQLLRRPIHRRIVIGAVLASACVQAYACFEQYFVGFDETWSHYQEIKEDFWANQGVPLDSDKVELFERRMLAHEASGFLPHSNVTGSYLVLCGITALGLTWSRRRDFAGPPARDAIPWPAVGRVLLSILIVFAAVLTKSRGALIAGGAGLLLWIMAVRFSPWIDSRRRSIFVGAWATTLIGLLAVIGHGLYHDSLPGWSLKFRWQYWKTSAKMIADHPWIGVGRENFGRRYLQYKPIEAAEEVSTPHNLFVQAAAEWGLPGLIGMAVMLVGASRAATRPRIRPSGGEPLPRRVVVAWGMALLTVLNLLRMPLLGIDDASFVYYATVTTCISWLTGFLFFTWPVSFNGLETTRTLRLVILAGLFGFLIHDLINFALFVPATASTFFALLAVAVAKGHEDDPPAENRCSGSRWVPAAAGAAVLVTVAILLIVPTARTTWYMGIVDRAVREGRSPGELRVFAEHYLQRAAQADPLDPAPLARRAEWLLTFSSLPEFHEEALRQAMASLDEASRRDPYQIQWQRMRTQVSAALAATTRNPDDYLAAVEAARRVVELYPADPSGHAVLGDRQLEAGKASGDRTLLLAAVASYNRALELDRSRPAWEVIRGFSRRRREAVESGIREAQTLQSP